MVRIVEMVEMVRVVEVVVGVGLIRGIDASMGEAVIHSDFEGSFSKIPRIEPSFDDFVLHHHLGETFHEKQGSLRSKF